MPQFNRLGITSATITLYKINEVALYSSEIISTNGNIFHPYDMETTLTFRVYKNSMDITDSFTRIEWRKFSFDSSEILEDEVWSRDYKNLKAIKINKNDFDKKCVIQADAYEIVDKREQCVASARITLLDINELYSNDTPPENPSEGALWIDTSGDVPIIYTWNSIYKEWRVVGKTNPAVRNLIQNSNFWRLNSTGFISEKEEYLYNLKTEYMFEKNWLNIKSYKVTLFEDMTAGVCQTTFYPINPKSDYTFSLKAYRKNTDEYTGENLFIKIISLNKDGVSTEIDTILRHISNDYKNQISYSFKSLDDTENIKVIIGVEPMKMCDFYITELSLYNTNRIYPWESSPEDLNQQLENKLNNDQESVFNALTKNGEMEGIYVSVDEDGKEHYYFNATHIKTGSLDGGLINGIGLNIKDDATGQSIFHVYKDEDGTHIDMVAQNLYIGTEPASTKKYADSKAAEAESNAAGYTNETVATNRAESEELLNNNIATTASNVITEMTEYVDGQVSDAISSNEGFTNGAIGTSEAALKTLISNTEKACKKYTDDEIDDLVKDIEDTVSDLNKNITKAKSDAITDSKKYTDDELTTHTTNMTDYIDKKVKTVNDEVIKKADSSTVSGIDGRLATVESKVVPNVLVSTVTSSIEYKTAISKMMDTESFNSFKTDLEADLSDMNKDIENRVLKTKVIETINNSSETVKISEDKLDLSAVTGTIDSPTDGIYASTLFSKGGLILTPGQEKTDLTIDTVINNMVFNVNELDIELDISSIAGTNYVKKATGNAQIYLNDHEIIKLLLHQMNSMQKRIDELEKTLNSFKDSLKEQ